MKIINKFLIELGIDGSECKPALVPDTEYMVKKKNHIASYLGAFGPYLMPQ